MYTFYQPYNTYRQYFSTPPKYEPRLIKYQVPVTFDEYMTQTYKQEPGKKKTQKKYATRIIEQKPHEKHEKFDDENIFSVAKRHIKSAVSIFDEEKKLGFFNIKSLRRKKNRLRHEKIHPVYENLYSENHSENLYSRNYSKYSKNYSKKNYSENYSENFENNFEKNLKKKEVKIKTEPEPKLEKELELELEKEHEFELEKEHEHEHELEKEFELQKEFKLQRTQKKPKKLQKKIEILDVDEIPSDSSSSASEESEVFDIYDLSKEKMKDVFSRDDIQRLAFRKSGLKSKSYEKLPINEAVHEMLKDVEYPKPLPINYCMNNQIPVAALHPIISIQILTKRHEEFRKDKNRIIHILQKYSDEALRGRKNYYLEKLKNLNSLITANEIELGICRRLSKKKTQNLT